MKRFFILTLLCAAVIATSCSKSSDDDSDEVIATGVSINQQTLALAMEQTITLTATVSPEDANDRSVTWSSSDESVATVSQEGVVTTHKAGTTTITATSNSGDHTATCVVTVSNVTYVAVTSVSINKGILNLTVGAKENLTATVKPKNATTKNVTWASQNNAIATVSATGEVTAVALGTTTVSVVTLDGEETDVCEVKVEEAAKVGFANEGTPGIDGSSWEKAYEIATKEQLVLLSTRVNEDHSKWGTKYYKLTENLQFSNISVTPWIPIGDTSGFGGYFDGGNHSIGGRFEAAPTATRFGIFGDVMNGEIKNLHFVGDILVSAINTADSHIGAIAAECNNSTITNCTNTASIFGLGTVGGITGRILRNAKIIACKNSGSMTSQSSNVGGIVGNGDAGLIIGCINKGTTMSVVDVNGSEYAAGITAVGKPIACWSVATSFTGNAKRVGAIVGHLFSNLSDLVSTDCYWMAINNVQGIGTEENDNGKNYSPFGGERPSVSMISAMNKAWQALIPDTKFGFNEYGEIVPM